MTLKKLFEKVDSYNEIADMMKTRKAKIKFYNRISDTNICIGESFDSYKDLCKYIRSGYTKEVADMILKVSDWQLDEELDVTYTDYFGSHTDTFCAELVAN